MSGNEQQLITISGNPNGGTYLLGFGGEMVNPALKYNASASAMTTALEALPTVGDGNITIYKRTSGSLFDVFFVNDLGARDVPLLDVDDSGLNRGSVKVSIITEGYPPSTTSSSLGEQLAAQEEANVQAATGLMDEQLAVAQAKREAMAAVPPEKRCL